MTFEGNELRVDHAIAVEGPASPSMVVSDLRPRTAMSLRVTLVDPEGREHGECEMTAEGGSSEGGGECRLGSAGGRSGGSWLVRYETSGAFSVRVRVQEP